MPAVLVTVTWYEPAGVPGSVGVDGELLLPPPHPKLASRKAINIRPRTRVHRRRRNDPPIRNVAPNNIAKLSARRPNPLVSRAAVVFPEMACGAAVTTLSVLLTLPPALRLTDAGLSEHVISTVVEDGVQERLTEPLNPPLEDTVTVDVPV